MAEVPVEGAPTEGGGGGLEELVGNIMKGLSMFSEILEKIPDAPPAAKEGMAAVMEGFQGVVSGLSGGGGEEAPPEAAPGPKRVPVQSAQGRPVSPAGV